jgi:acetyl esterase/lipase
MNWIKIISMTLILLYSGADSYGIPLFSLDSEETTPTRVLNKSLLLWEKGAPGAMGDKENDKPRITVYFPSSQTTNRPAIIICPGGAYGMLAISYEGYDIARWLNKHDVVGVVLQYRVSPYRYPSPVLDGQRAVRLVRARAKEWGIDPHKIGMMGFSAGGHLASTVATHFDKGNPEADDPVERYSSRPDFLILVYPVITMGKYTHAGSRRNLLGNRPEQSLIDTLSNEKHVTPDTPPTFIVHPRPDNVVSVENSRMFYSALLTNNVPVEFLELSEGDHGLGCGEGELWLEWQNKCLAWLKRMGILSEEGRQKP